MVELKQNILKTEVQNKKLNLSIQNSIIQYIKFRLDFNQENRDKAMSENISQTLNTT